MNTHPAKRLQKWFEWFLSSDTYTLEVQNATLAIIVGSVFILNTESIYDRASGTYRWIEFAPAWFWGMVYLFAGTAHLTFLLLGYRWCRKQILLIKAGLWIFLAICVLNGNPWAISGYFYIVFFILALRGFLQVQILKEKSIKNAL